MPLGRLHVSVMQRFCQGSPRRLSYGIETHPQPVMIDNYNGPSAWWLLIKENQASNDDKNGGKQRPSSLQQIYSVLRIALMSIKWNVLMDSRVYFVKISKNLMEFMIRRQHQKGDHGRSVSFCLLVLLEFWRTEVQNWRCIFCHLDISVLGELQGTALMFDVLAFVGNFIRKLNISKLCKINSWFSNSHDTGNLVITQHFRKSALNIPFFILVKAIGFINRAFFINFEKLIHHFFICLRKNGR